MTNNEFTKKKKYRSGRHLFFSFFGKQRKKLALAISAMILTIFVSLISAGKPKRK
jgi:hypothetical protein